MSSVKIKKIVEVVFSTKYNQERPVYIGNRFDILINNSMTTICQIIRDVDDQQNEDLLKGGPYKVELEIISDSNIEKGINKDKKFYLKGGTRVIAEGRFLTSDIISKK